MRSSDVASNPLRRFSFAHSAVAVLECRNLPCPTISGSLGTGYRNDLRPVGPSSPSSSLQFHSEGGLLVLFSRLGAGSGPKSWADFISSNETRHRCSPWYLGCRAFSTIKERPRGGRESALKCADFPVGNAAGNRRLSSVVKFSDRLGLSTAGVKSGAITEARYLFSKSRCRNLSEGPVEHQYSVYPFMLRFPNLVRRISR